MKQKVTKPVFPKAIPAGDASKLSATPSSGSGLATTTTRGATAPAGAISGFPPLAGAGKSTLADWAATEDDDYMYGGGGGVGVGGEKRQRGGRKRKQKRKQQLEQQRQETDWDELYDPARPTNVEEYLRSDEKIREVREWKALLYAHRRQRRHDRRRSGSSSGSGDGESGDDAMSVDDGAAAAPQKRQHNPMFAPPTSYSFAPPPPESPPHGDTVRPAQAAPPPPDDASTGDDAYARRLALSQAVVAPPQQPPQQAPGARVESHDEDSSSSEAPSPPAEEAPPPPPQPAEAGVVVSRAPVRYAAVPAPADSDAEMADSPAGEFGLESSGGDATASGMEGEEGGANNNASTQQDEAEWRPRANRPGQAGFARRLLAKYGWTAGQGLGAAEQGMATPLRVQMEKKKARRAKNAGGGSGGWDDDDGGGGKGRPVQAVGARGKIIAGKASRKPKARAAGGGGSATGEGEDGAEEEEEDGEEEEEGYGATSAVVLLRNMLENMEDLEAEMEDGLLQEIGEECGEKYGRVERLYIDPETRRVFIKFTDQVSALRVSFCVVCCVYRALLTLPSDRPSTPCRAAFSTGMPSWPSFTTRTSLSRVYMYERGPLPNKIDTERAMLYIAETRVKLPT